MAYHGFLKIKGFTGSSQATDHQDEIEIKKWEQRFTYGKQDLGDTVEKFNIALQDENASEFYELKALQRKMPNLEKLQKHHNNGGRNKKEMLEYEKMLTDFNKWYTDYNKLLKELTEKLDKNKNLNQAFDNFKAFITDFKGELKDSNHDPMKFDKIIDTASAKLLEACCIGEKIPTCTFSLYRSIIPSTSDTIHLAEKGKNDFIEVTLNEVYITNYTINGDSDMLPTETLELNYDIAIFKFVEGNAKTGQKGSHKIISWNWTKGTAKTI